MNEPEIEVVPPCRVLMRNGQSVDELVTSRVRVSEREDNPLHIPLKPDTPYMLDRKSLRGRAAKPKAAKRERHAPQNERPDVTLSAVVAMLRAGKPIARIALDLGCSADLIFLRLRDAKRTPDGAELLASLHICVCGGRKQAHRAQCWDCKSGRSARP